jgi:DNA-binding transcriptional LysR family regulator
MRHDIQTLRLFIAAYEERSIAKAAHRENIVPSALSKRLSDLEASLRVTLFHRHRNGLEPTAAANAVLHHARLVMRELLQMESELLDFGAGLKGQVRIHANVWAIVEYLPDDLASFAAEHPLVRIDLEENISSGIIRAIGENAADIGVLASSVPTPGLHVIPYRSDRLVAIMPKDHPLAGRVSVRLEDLAAYDVVGPKRGSAMDGLLMQASSGLGLPLRMRVRATGFDAVARLAEARMGIGFAPAQAARRHSLTSAVTAVPIDGDWAQRQLNLCVSSLNTLSPAAALLVGHLSRP